MLLLSHSTGGRLVLHVGLLSTLDMSSDLDIIHDIAVTHFKKELNVLRPDIKFDKAVIVIKDNESPFISSFVVEINPFSERPAKRTYFIEELPILNDAKLDNILKP